MEKIKMEDIGNIGLLLIQTEEMLLADIIIEEFSHVSILAKDVNNAKKILRTNIERTGVKYIPVIRMMDSDLSDLLTFTRTVEKDTVDASETDSTADAVEDNVLIKENDTPDGVNQDLTLDTYLSRAERQKSEMGERKGNVKVEREANELLRDLDRNQALLMIGQLNNLLSDQYRLWINEISKALFIYELD